MEEHAVAAARQHAARDVEAVLGIARVGGREGRRGLAVEPLEAALGRVGLEAERGVPALGVRDVRRARRRRSRDSANAHPLRRRGDHLAARVQRPHPHRERPAWRERSDQARVPFAVSHAHVFARRSDAPFAAHRGAHARLAPARVAPAPAPRAFFAHPRASRAATCTRGHGPGRAARQTRASSPPRSSRVGLSGGGVGGRHRGRDRRRDGGPARASASAPPAASGRSASPSPARRSSSPPPRRRRCRGGRSRPGRRRPGAPCCSTSKPTSGPGVPWSISALPETGSSTPARTLGIPCQAFERSTLSAPGCVIRPSIRLGRNALRRNSIARVRVQVLAAADEHAVAHLQRRALRPQRRAAGRAVGERRVAQRARRRERLEARPDRPTAPATRR